jgi:hypothetical protein
VTGLQIAAPVLAATLVADVILGFLGKASPQMPLMFFRRVGINKNIVQINQHKSVDIRTQNRIHHRLKGSRSIGKTEWHNKKFILAVPSIKRCFWDIYVGNSDLPISRQQIQDSTMCSLSHLINTVLNSRQRICILDCLQVQGPIINTHPPFSRGLWLAHK